MPDWKPIDDAAKNSLATITLKLRSGRIVDALWADPDQVIGDISDAAITTGRWVATDPTEAPITGDDPPIAWRTWAE